MLYQVVKHLRAPRETFKGALLTVLDKKATTAYVKAKEQLLLKNGLLYRKTNIGPAKETIFQFVVPQRHRSAAMDGCHREAAHSRQRRSASLMQERFWWPGMARDLRNRIRKCGRCRKFEAAPPIAPMQPLTCSGPGELLHVDFTSIEETVPLKRSRSYIMCWSCKTTSLVCRRVCGEGSDRSYGCRDSEKRIFRVVRSTRIPSQ